MIKQCHCHVINVRNYATVQTLYDITGWDTSLETLFPRKTGYVSELSSCAIECKIKVKHGYHQTMTSASK